MGAVFILGIEPTRWEFVVLSMVSKSWGALAIQQTMDALLNDVAYVRRKG